MLNRLLMLCVCVCFVAFGSSAMTSEGHSKPALHPTAKEAKPSLPYGDAYASLPTWVIIASPYLNPSVVDKRKSFGDASWLMGNDLADSLRLTLHNKALVFSPSDVWVALQEAGHSDKVQPWIESQREGRGILFPQLGLVQAALRKKYGSGLRFHRLLVLESNLDFTQPYQPNSWGDKVNMALTGSLMQHKQVFVYNTVYQYNVASPTAPLLDRFSDEQTINGDALVAFTPSVAAHASTRSSFQKVARSLAVRYCSRERDRQQLWLKPLPGLHARCQ